MSGCKKNKGALARNALASALTSSAPSVYCVFAQDLRQAAPFRSGMCLCPLQFPQVIRRVYRPYANMLQSYVCPVDSFMISFDGFVKSGLTDSRHSAPASSQFGALITILYGILSFSRSVDLTNCKGGARASGTLAVGHYENNGTGEQHSLLRWQTQAAKIALYVVLWVPSSQ